MSKVIDVLFGDNSYEVEQQRNVLIAASPVDVEQYDGSELTKAQLMDMLLAQNLFQQQRFIVVRRLTQNTALGGDLPSLLEKLPDSTSLVLVEQHIDKRTATYKWLRGHATMHEYKQWGERETSIAERWAENEAKTRGVVLNKKLAHQLVVRSGLDQWRIAGALDKLALASDINEATITELVELAPAENIFSLLETALSGTTEKLHAKIGELSLVEDAYKVHGLLASQAFQLAVLQAADSGQEVARDIGAHPFVLAKLASHAKRLSRTQVRQIVQALAVADTRLKSTDADPWAIIEEALLRCQQASHGI